MKYAFTLTAFFQTVLFAPLFAALEVGSLAPDMELPATDGQTVRLSDHRGSWVVLYFYPKADTPGCTRQSCSLRDEHTLLLEEGIVVLGASVDNLKDQQDFKEGQNLPFTLLADDDKQLSKAFDVLGLGGIFAQRKTFIINPEGRIAYVFDRVRVSDHGTEVLTKLKELKDDRP